LTRDLAARNLAYRLKTWTHLPEKPLSKNKGTRSARAMSQWDERTK